jgi:hypothetical protein
LNLELGLIRFTRPSSVFILSVPALLTGYARLQNARQYSKPASGA